MPTFQDLRDSVASLVKDEAKRLTADERDSILLDAVRRFSRKVPRIVAKEVAGDGGFDYALPAGYVDGVSSITSIYFPYDPTYQRPEKLEPKDFQIFRHEASTKLRFLNSSPAVGQKALVLFTAPHTAETSGPNTAVATLSPAGTVIAGPSTSTPADVESAGTARAFVDISAIDAGAVLDVFIQASKDGVEWVDIGAFNPLSAVGSYIVPLEKFKVSKNLRLRYAVVGGSATLTARLDREEKTGSLTVADAHLDVLAVLGAAIQARALADFYAGTSDSSLSGDTTDYASKSEFWASRADEWQESYDAEADKLQPVEPSGAFAQGEWDIESSSGYGFLGHGSRFR